MVSAEREPITEVRGRSPKRGPEAEPVVGAKGKVRLKLKAFCPFSYKRGPKVK